MFNFIPFMVEMKMLIMNVLLILYRQVVGIPIGTNCAPLVADLFLFCYEIYSCF